MAELNYDNSSFFNDLFQGWLFKSLKSYNKVTPNFNNLFKVPEKMHFEKDLRKIESLWEKEKRRPKPNFLKVVVKALFKEYLIIVLLILVSLTMNLTALTIVNFLIKYLEDPSKPLSEGIVLLVSFCVPVLISATFKANGFLRSSILTAKIKSIITSLISKRLLNLSLASVTDQNNRGKIVNVVNSDIEALELLMFTAFFWCTPFVVIFSIIIVVLIFGPAGVIGIGISLIHVPILMIIGKVSMKNRMAAGKEGDFRIKMIENLVEGIKIMKLYAWEKPFLRQIFSQRKVQEKQQRVITNYNGIMIVIGTIGASLTIFCSVIVHLYVGNTLEPGRTFVLVGVLTAVHLNIVYLTTTGINTIYVFIAIMKRVQDLMLLNVHQNLVTQGPIHAAILAYNLSISWKESDKTDSIVVQKNEGINTSLFDNLNQKPSQIECLHNVSFTVVPQEKVMIIGPVGCGKSSLLITLLGELQMLQGSASITGKVAYASEEPWLVSGSVKDNILMGRPFNAEVYTEVLNVCCLIKDLSLFEHGDETIVGDRGATLSGGQKARLSLARAIYTNADIYLLDDPLSAVDPEVASNLFADCIQGYLAQKTVLVATHQLQFLPQANKIIVLDNERLVFCGTYQELAHNDSIQSVIGEFAHFEDEAKSIIGKKELKVEEKNVKVDIEDEKASNSAITFNTYWNYLLFGFRSGFVVLFIFLVGVASQMCFVFFFYWISLWSKSSDQNSSYYYVGAGILLGATYGSFILRVYLIVNLLFNCNATLHNGALKSIAYSPSVYFDKNPTGRILNRFSKDIGVVDGPLQYFLQEIFSVAITLVGIFCIMIIFMPYNAIAFSFWLFLLYLLLKYVSPIIIHLRKLELASRGPVLSTINSILNGLATLRSLSLNEKFESIITQQINQYHAAYLNFNMFLRFSQLYADLGSALIIIFNATIIIATKGDLDTATAAFSLFYSLSLLGPSSIFSKTLVDVQSSMATVQRLLEYVDLPPEENSKSSTLFEISRGSIKFEDVFMKYRPNYPYVLSGLTLKIKAGHKIGIIGRTGSGKSSILQVLFRMVNPEKGRILIDNIDYMNIDLFQLRTQMSVIPQFPTLFSGSIKFNVDPLNLHTDFEVYQVINELGLYKSFRKSQLYEKIGIEINLSAGQKQLLCLARAILRNNKIVVMDEATANVDNETDNLVQDMIKKKFKDATLIVIAHRIRTIIKSNRIAVIDKGICQEYGKPKKLARQDDSFLRSMILSTGSKESAFLFSQID